MAAAPLLKIKLQIMCGGEIAMGPGKADLLDAIAREGSISGAGRALGISYRRCWLLVDAMNRCWAAPLVETPPGSRAARVTGLGRQVLAGYRRLQQVAAEAGTDGSWHALEGLLREQPLARQGS